MVKTAEDFFYFIFSGPKLPAPDGLVSKMYHAAKRQLNPLLLESLGPPVWN